MLKLKLGLLVTKINNNLSTSPIGGDKGARSPIYRGLRGGGVLFGFFDIEGVFIIKQNMLEIEKKDGIIVGTNNYQHSFELTIGKRIDWNEAHSFMTELFGVLKMEHSKNDIAMFFLINKIYDDLYSVKFQTYIENDDNGTFPTVYLITQLFKDYELEVFDLTTKEKENFLLDINGADFGMLAYFKPDKL